MDLTLTRKEFRPDGIFGELKSDCGTIKLVTLERSYDDDKSPRPKVPTGKYLCVKGMHRYKSGKQYETFEITDVPGHTGILFHVGNHELDSEGCVLLGSKIMKFGQNGHHAQMIVNSKIAFEAFMHHQSDVDEFWLEIVVDPAAVPSLALN